MPLKSKAVAISAGIGFFIFASNTAHAADYQKYLNGDCSAGGVCNIDFPNVPQGKILTVSNLSCYLRFYKQLRLYGAQLLLINNTSGAIVHAVTPALHEQNTVVTPPNIEEFVYVSNDNIHAFAKQGQHFRAYAEIHNPVGTVGPVNQFACHISGTLTP